MRSASSQSEQTCALKPCSYSQPHTLHWYGVWDLFQSNQRFDQGCKYQSPLPTPSAQSDRQMAESTIILMEADAV